MKDALVPHPANQHRVIKPIDVGADAEQVARGRQTRIRCNEEPSGQPPAVGERYDRSFVAVCYINDRVAA